MAKGRKKTSRKGKKAWRANISNKELDDYVQRAALEERTGGALETLPDENLFFVDKSPDASLVKKTAKYKERALHSDIILERQSQVPCLLAPKRKIKKAKAVRPTTLSHDGAEVKARKTKKAFDIWGLKDGLHNKENCNNKVQIKKARNAHHSAAAAVEIDAPGCSFNPGFEDHQDALGLAVAQEMQKVYKKELEPAPIPLTVPGAPIDEEDVFFLDVGDDAEEISSDGEDYTGGSRPVKVKKLTRADLNKRKRRKEHLRVLEESAKRTKLQKDLLRLKDIKREIDIEDAAKQKDCTRRTVSKQERQAQGPPRLGKLRYQPEPMQVLLSEEVTGSLRKLKGCYSLAKDRYKSLQRRGLIEPRQPGQRRARKKRKEYEQGSKGHLEREMHGAA